MMKLSRFGLFGGVLLSATSLPLAAATAYTAAPTGAEITGHAVNVEVGGVTNTVYFDPGGRARIISPMGREVEGTWAVQNQSLCLMAGTARECWPYLAEFRAGQPVELTSDCAVLSRWTPLSTAVPAPPPVETGKAGERG